MEFKIESKDDDGNIIFSGTASQREAFFLLTVAINFLLANGTMPLLTGQDSEVGISTEPTSVQ